MEPKSRDWTLKTERVLLQPLAADDLIELHQVFVRPEVRRFLWDDIEVSQDTVAEILDRNEEFFAANAPGLWGARMHGRRPIIGFVGFWTFFDPPVHELLYGFVGDFWGRGLATEAGKELIRFARDDLGRASIQASTDRLNAASQRVLARLGFVSDEARQAVTERDEPETETLHYIWHARR